MAVIETPTTKAVRTPRRAISNEPGTAAIANSIDGRPVRMPIWVALKDSSSWISGMTGGTANMVRRSATPASHSSTNAVRKRACKGAALESFMEFSPALQRRGDTINCAAKHGDVRIPNENSRIYAIGDIHGRLDLLERAIAAIERDVAQYGPDALTVTLGDYVDRGPESRGVLDHLAANPFPTPYIALKGNHEELLATFLADPATGAHWRRLGGLETMHSYGVPVSRLMFGRTYDEAARQFRAALPAAHIQFLQSLRNSVSHGKYFLCHAGVRPGVPLDRQDERDLLWIRSEFLGSDVDFGKIIVHGHTPVERPEVLPNRINIDTAAFATGQLTCVALEDSGHRFLRV